MGHRLLQWASAICSRQNNVLIKHGSHIVKKNGCAFVKKNLSTDKKFENLRNNSTLSTRENSRCATYYTYHIKK